MGNELISTALDGAIVFELNTSTSDWPHARGIAAALAAMAVVLFEIFEALVAMAEVLVEI
jgi:hypothetical protein